MDQIIWFTFLIAGVSFILYATLGRAIGRHKPMRWDSGGEMSFLAELSFGVFLLALGLAAMREPALWFFVAILAFCVGFAELLRSSKKEANRRTEQRKVAMSEYAFAFSDYPPLELEKVAGEWFSIFDLDESVYLGEISRSNLRTLIDQFSHLNDGRTNDLYLLEESVCEFRPGAFSEETIRVLKRGFAKEGSMTLRWMPQLIRAQPSERDLANLKRAVEAK